MTDSAQERERGQPLKDAVLSVRFDRAVIEAAAAVAAEEGMTVSNWVRRLVRREIVRPEMTELPVEGLEEPVRVPADALRSVISALTPVLARYPSVSVVVGAHRIAAMGPVSMTTITPVAVIPGEQGPDVPPVVVWTSEMAETRKDHC